MIYPVIHSSPHAPLAELPTPVRPLTAFELDEQLRPDIIYLPMGTGGTLAGLLTGFLLTNIRPAIKTIFFPPENPTQMSFIFVMPDPYRNSSRHFMLGIVTIRYTAA